VAGGAEDERVRDYLKDVAQVAGGLAAGGVDPRRAGALGIVQHVYRQTRKLSRIAIICHSKSALDIHPGGCATLSHGQMTSDDRERRYRPAAGTAAADVCRQSRSDPMSERDDLEETPR
jgi:hypothetical protein